MSHAHTHSWSIRQILKQTLDSTYLLLHHHTLYLTIHSGLTSSVFYITTLFTSLYTVTLHSLSATSHYTDVYMYDSYCTLTCLHAGLEPVCVCVCVCVCWGLRAPFSGSMSHSNSTAGNNGRVRLVYTVGMFT